MQYYYIAVWRNFSICESIVEDPNVALCASTDRAAGAIDPILTGHVPQELAKLLSLYSNQMLLMERSEACPLLLTT